MLYNEFTNNDIIHGIENFLINFPIFSVPNMFSSFSIFSPSLFLIFLVGKELNFGKATYI